MEKQFKIIAKTNAYIAQRDGKFKGRVEYVVEENMSLENAREELQRMADSDYENEGGCDLSFHSKDLKSYEYDSRYYSIEEMETLSFSIKTYPSNAEISINSDGQYFNTFSLYMEDVDSDSSTDSNMTDLIEEDIKPNIPKGYVIDQESYDSMIASVRIWIDSHCSNKKHQFIASGEKVEVTNETRDFGHGEQVKVIYSDGSEGWEHLEDLID